MLDGRQQNRMCVAFKAKIKIYQCHHSCNSKWQLDILTILLFFPHFSICIVRIYCSTCWTTHWNISRIEITIQKSGVEPTDQPRLWYVRPAMLFGYDLLSNYSMNILLIDGRAAQNARKTFDFYSLNVWRFGRGVRAVLRKMLLFECVDANKNSNTQDVTVEKCKLKIVSRCSTWVCLLFRSHLRRKFKMPTWWNAFVLLFCWNMLKTCFPFSATRTDHLNVCKCTIETTAETL